MAVRIVVGGEAGLGTVALVAGAPSVVAPELDSVLSDADPEGAPKCVGPGASVLTDPWRVVLGQ